MAEHRAAIILAAGKGKRMKSDLPKVLHEIHGRPMIQLLLDRLVALALARTIVVIGYKGEEVEAALGDYPVQFAWQREQLGTGHAVMMTRPQMESFSGTTAILLGDVPFLSRPTIEKLFDTHERTGAAATVLSAIVDDPAGYGRIVRDGPSDRLRAIVEDKDADEAVRAIREINTGTMCFDNRLLFESLSKITNQNAQGEYYLTDCIELLFRAGRTVSLVAMDNPDEGLGVNSVEQLELLARKFAAK